MSDMHKMNKNNIFDFVLTLPAEGSVFFIPTFPHRPCPSRAQNRKFNIAGNACIQYIQLKMFISDGMKK